MNVRRSDPFVRTVAASWRSLTSPARSAHRSAGEPVVVACSAGADSSALAIALAAAGAKIVIAHIVHDLRPRAAALRDRDAAKTLAERLGVRFAERSVRVKTERGNAEAIARRLRYAALLDIAHEHGYAFIATAHHAIDQAESVLMALIRGGGPRALAGIAAIKPLRRGPRVSIIRPMLGLTADDAHAFCTRAGWAWVEDETNADASGARLRSALRHRVIPELLAIRPAAADGIGRSAALQSRIASMLRRAARRADLACAESPETWSRATLRRVSEPVLGELLRDHARGLSRGRGIDRLNQATIDAAVRIIRSSDTDPHTLDWPGVRVMIDSKRVRMVRARSV